MNKAEVVSKMGDTEETNETTEKSAPERKRKRLKTVHQIPDRTITTRSLTRQADKARFDQFLDGTQIHPLLVDHIVDKIFEYVVWSNITNVDRGFQSRTLEERSKNLRNFRLVCRQWSDQGAKLYRKKSCPEVRFGAPVKNPWDVFDLRMEKYLNDMYHSRVIPVQRYIFDASYFIQENNLMFKEFMLTFGSTIVELQLFFDCHSNMSFDRESFEKLNLKNLKILLISLGGLMEYPYLLQRTHEILLEAILRSAVNLQRFWFRIPERNLSKYQLGVFERSSKIILDNVPKTMKVLNVHLLITQLRKEGRNIVLSNDDSDLTLKTWSTCCYSEGKNKGY